MLFPQIYLILYSTQAFFIYFALTKFYTYINIRNKFEFLSTSFNLDLYNAILDSLFFKKEVHEQGANVFSKSNPLWILLNNDFYFNDFILMILWFPLFFCFIILLFYFLNYFHQIFFGKISYIESWEINSYVWNKNSFFKFYKYLQKIIWKNSEHYLKTFPNPLHLFATTKLYFLWWREPPFWKYIIIFIFFYFFLLSSIILTCLFTKICFILLIYFFTKNNIWTEPLGLKLKIFTVHYHIWSSSEFKNLHEWFYHQIKVTYFPIFLSFSLFVFSLLLLGLLYIDFFTEAQSIWNGYFSKTLISIHFSGLPYLNIYSSLISFDYFIGLDGLNIWLIVLTSLLVYLCALFCWENQINENFLLQMFWIFLLQYASFQFFVVTNYIWMYIFFELSLLPIFVLIIFYGSNRWKIYAAYQMVLFTFVGSIFLLTGIFLLYLKLNTFNILDIFFYLWEENYLNMFSYTEKKLIWLFLFLGFAVKTPLYPFHVWLPEAHSEAPTPGSVLLAGVLLKMGTYGFLWFVLPIFPEILEDYKTFIYAMCLSGMLFSSCSALAQIDVKRIIAYSSIGHMGLVILGACSLTFSGLLGSSFMMISHGLISSAMFFSIGILYWIYGTRILIYYTSIAHFMPRFTALFFFFSLANMGFPGTAGFPPELLIFSSLVSDNFFFLIFVGFSAILGGTYSIWLLTRLIYGQISAKITTYWDLESSERRILIYLVFFTLLLGLLPGLMLDFFKPFCSFITNFKTF